MSDSDENKTPVEITAARWMARRDRGFTPAEQDEYLQWLSEDPEHGAEVARLGRAWDRLDGLRRWNPTHSAQPNPDLLEPPRLPWWRRPQVFAAAAALALAAGVWWALPYLAAPAENEVVMLPGARRLALEDGSMIELNQSARVEVNFDEASRRVTLLEGEAHFIVAKNPRRPFVVEAGAFEVQAVGTAFNVSLADEALGVLVTEGVVQLGSDSTSPAAVELPRLTARQHAIVPSASPAAFKVFDLTPAEVEAALQWQSLRLEFQRLPLREVIAEFNRYNSRQLVIADRATGDVLVGGTFRADNVEAFVRLLDLGFDIRASSQEDDIVLSLRAE